MENERQQHRMQRGFLLVGVGAVLGFVSCVLTLTDISPALNNLFLFGLTPAAAVILLIGCYLIFEP